MRRFARLFLFVTALAVGGVLGYELLSNFESLGSLNWVLFMITCLVLGEVFHLIDKWICEHHKK